ncbi:MAG: HAMP domain-containing histidine kinase [Alphaproteobacteria bacterium]|nr:HAMP domain-containing histidine kinase [Alphaproteobacteria bacterium]
MMLSWIPPTLRLPLAAGLIIFVVAVGTTQVALRFEAREAESQVRRVGQVYLDGLVTAARPALEAGDLAELSRLFALAFAEQRGISERALFAFDPEGGLLARVGDPALRHDPAPGPLREAFRIDAQAGVAWVSRRVEPGPGFVLLAALDFRDVLDARRRLVIAVVLVDLVIAAACALLAYGLLNRLNRPVVTMVRELEAASAGVPAPLPEATIAAADARIRPIYGAFNRMVGAMREREQLAAELAEKEQAAALGRLAATIAHEVRNPLGGLATAVSTIRRFGADAEVRTESLGLLERGIETLDRLVTSTLNLYRPEQERRLTRTDFEDLERLVRPAAEKHGVALEWDIAVPASLALGAVGVRQVLLNLLLNACAASPAGGRVGLAARVEDGALVCIVTDQGGGMDPRNAEWLEAGRMPASGSRRLGMDVVVSMLGSLAGRASVASDPAHGTTIRVAIPLEAGA